MSRTRHLLQTETALLAAFQDPQTSTLSQRFLLAQQFNGCGALETALQDSYSAHFAARDAIFDLYDDAETANNGNPKPLHAVCSLYQEEFSYQSPFERVFKGLIKKQKIVLHKNPHFAEHGFELNANNFASALNVRERAQELFLRGCPR